MNNKILTFLFVLGAILILVSSVLIMEHIPWGKYTFAIGVALYIMNRLRQNYTGTDFRLKRLNRFNFINSILLVLISYLQFKGINAWVVLLLIVAIVEMWISFRVAVYEKEVTEEANKGPTEEAQ
jgi:signal transduction histidine kinase